MSAAPRDLTPDSNHYDLIIVGAGVNGAGIARDASMRGLRSLLLDKGDISSGTSSWSTRLIHGGLRYLEYGEVGLVREALRDREHLLHLAPHLVKPLLLLIPIYDTNKHGHWAVRVGMIAYDVLSFDKSLDHHHMFSRQQTLEHLPGLSAAGLRGAALYYDAQVEYAERMVIENAMSAREHGATVRTYARVDQLLLEGNRVAGVTFTDLLDGQTHTAHAPVTLNVAGPWVDQVLQGLGRPVPRLIGGTKGSHIVVARFPDAPRGDGLYVEALADNRPFFILPWNDHYLIGTTDIRYDGSLDHVEADEAEIEYLIRETNRVLPAANLTRESVLYSYSGIRPLPYVPEGKEAGITRRHILHDHAPEVEGLISIVGGKLSTYRSLSEQTVDAVYGKLGRTAPPCPTGKAPLPGGMSENFAQFATSFMADRRSLSAQTANHLLRVYGTRVRDVLRVAGEAPELHQVFDPDTGAIGAEVVVAVREEMARTLSDILLRRTMAGLGPAAGLNADRAAAQIAARYLGWDQARVDREVEAYRQYIQRFHPRAAGSAPGVERREWGGRLAEAAPPPPHGAEHWPSSPPGPGAEEFRKPQPWPATEPSAGEPPARYDHPAAPHGSAPPGS